MGFVREVRKTLIFEGQSVEVSIKPIEYGDFLDIEAVGKDDHSTLMKLMTSTARKYASFAVAPKAADGSAVTIDEVCVYPYFMDLLTGIFKAIFETGRIENPLVSGGNSPSG